MMGSVGRNVSCPCGSGKKYKKCCLPKDEKRHDINTELIKAPDPDDWGYALFDQFFPDMARRETRSIVVFDGQNTNLPDAVYTFHEMFCIEQGCDCRRVFFYVVSSLKKDVVAVIAYGWESASFYRDWFKEGESFDISELKGPSLNIGSPQSEFAPEILELVKNKLLCDHDYIERIKSHYRIFKEKINV